MSRQPSIRTLFGLSLATACLVFADSGIRAHDPGLSTSRIRVTKERVVTSLEFHNADLTAWLQRQPSGAGLDRDGDGRLDPLELRTASARVQTMVLAGVGLFTGGKRAELASFRVEILPEDEDIGCTIAWVRGQDAALQWQVDLLRDLARGHRQYCVAMDESGAILAETLLGGGASRFDLPSTRNAGGPGAANLAGRFLVLGVEHILIGYDHILFLLGLLLVCSTWRNVLITVSAFTLAHSLTLVGATLGVLRLPGTLVEAVIAGSIVYVGIKNLLRRGRPEGRAPFVVTFVFGLIHGFGFASVLSDLGLAEAGGVFWPLVSFNIGVELGQLAIAAVLVPLLWFGARRLGGERIAMVGSAAVTFAGLYWLIARTVLA